MTWLLMMIPTISCGTKHTNQPTKGGISSIKICDKGLFCLIAEFIDLQRLKLRFVAASLLLSVIFCCCLPLLFSMTKHTKQPTKYINQSREISATWSQCLIVEFVDFHQLKFPFVVGHRSGELCLQFFDANIAWIQGQSSTLLGVRQCIYDIYRHEVLSVVTHLKSRLARGKLQDCRILIYVWTSSG